MANRTIYSMYVIYHLVADHPGPYTVRRFEIERGTVIPTDDASDHLTLEDARAAVPFGLVNFPRVPSDPHVVVESWL